MQIYNPSDRYRQRKKNQVLSLASRLVLFVFAAFVGYLIAGQGDVKRLANLQAQNELLQEERATLQAALMELKTSERTANMKFQQLQESARGILDDAALQEIVGLVRTQLDKGMSPERLKMAVRASKPPSNCSDAKVDRFVVSTPNYQGEANAFSVASGAIKISANGRSAKGSSGKNEAWFDPKKPIDIVFDVRPPAATGQKDILQKKRKTLPFYHTVVVGKREYRFTISEGAQSFAKVTFDSCDYP